MEISDASRTLAGILPLSLVTVGLGGAFLLRIVRGRHPATALQQSFFRAGHAHAGVLLVLGLTIQPYVDTTDLSGAAEWLARSGVPAAALLMPAGFFLSVLTPDAERPNRLVWLIAAGATMLGIGLATAGVGLLAA